MKRCLIVLFPLLTAAMLTGCVADIEDQVRVVRVVDGDTIEIEGGERVRYIGIDTPEVYPSEEYYGIEAWEKNRELVGGLFSDFGERCIGQGPLWQTPSLCICRWHLY